MALEGFSSDEVLFWARLVNSEVPNEPRTEALLVRLEHVEMETKEEQGRSVQGCTGRELAVLG